MIMATNSTGTLRHEPNFYNGAILNLQGTRRRITQYKYINESNNTDQSFISVNPTLAFTDAAIMASSTGMNGVLENPSSNTTLKFICVIKIMFGTKYRPKRLGKRGIP